MVDDREKGDQIQVFTGVFPVWEKTRLPVADYALGGIGFEYKSLWDFAQDAGHELWQKLDNLQQYPSRVLVVVGSFDEMRARDPRYRYNRGEFESAKARVEGALMAVTLGGRVGLVRCEDYIELEKWLKLLRKRLERDPREFQRPIETRKPPSRTLDEEVEDVLCAVTGIGRKASRAILTKLGDLETVSYADVATLKEVDGLGPKKAEHVHEVFHHVYKPAKE